MLASDYLVESRADEALVSSALSLVIPKSGLKYQLRQNPVERYWAGSVVRCDSEALLQADRTAQQVKGM
jgi:hypothetical protein